MAKETEVPLETIGISAAEFEELKAHTKRFSGDVKAIFSVNRDLDIWSPTGKGNTPLGRREYLTDISYVLDQLARSLRRRRLNGGRIFVDLDGAFWKKGATGETERIRFTSWRWKGDPPQQDYGLPIPIDLSYKDIVRITKENRMKTISSRGKVDTHP